MRKISKAVLTLAAVSAMMLGATITANAETGSNEQKVLDWYVERGYDTDSSYYKITADQFEYTPGDISDTDVTVIEETISSAKALYNEMKADDAQNTAANRLQLVEYAQEVAGVVGGGVIGLADETDNIDKCAVFVRYIDGDKSKGIAKMFYGDGTDYITSGLITVDGTQYVVVDGATPTTTGIYAVNGTRYYVDGTTGQIKSYTGIVKASDGKFYNLVNGVFKNYTGIVKNTSGNGKWYNVVNGVFTSYTGIVKNASNGLWYYVKGGVFTSYTGIVKNTSGNGKWYYVVNGIFKSYSGIVKNTSGNGKWYYVRGGVFTSYYGIVKNTSGNGKWYYVRAGVFDGTATGLVKNTSGNGTWYYVKSGVFTSYTGTAKINGYPNGKSYNVVKGVLK